jgi:hypothetical protein
MKFNYGKKLYVERCSIIKELIIYGIDASQVNKGKYTSGLGW